MMFSLISCLLNITCLSIICLSTDAFAAGGGTDQTTDMIYRFINFAILFGFLYFVLSKPLKNYLAARSEGVQKALDEAKRIREEAEKRFKEYQDKMKHLAEEARELRDTLIKEGQIEKERIIGEADRAARRIGEQAKFTAEQEIKKARLALKEETANLIADMAEDKIRKGIKDSDHDRLMREYLSTSGGIH